MIFRVFAWWWETSQTGCVRTEYMVDSVFDDNGAEVEKWWNQMVETED
jgi:hypothetical protein